LLPEIKAYMAKARLKRGIEMVKLANRIESLKMQDDEDPENSDFPKDAAAAAESGAAPAGASASSGDSKSKITQAMKGAIFREVVLAKVREMKDNEETLKVKEEAEAEAKRKSFSA
jgi:calcium/calmodulin-dependent protein kinase I